MERSFVDAKELHGHRYARFRGLAKVRAQALLAAACQSIKQIARLLEQAWRAMLALFARLRTAPQAPDRTCTQFSKEPTTGSLSKLALA